jgi:hypothetical protein
MKHFARYIGIDYSGAGDPASRQEGIQVFVVEQDSKPQRAHTDTKGAKHWNRSEMANWLKKEIGRDIRTIVGIDHAFSFPEAYFKKHRLKNWDEFLKQFCPAYPTKMYSVKTLRQKGMIPVARKDLRLVETWASSAKSVFDFDGPGVASSTFAGLPWLADLRETLRGRLHFWPFDGFPVKEGKSVVAEVCPAIFRKRFKTQWEGDERDAFAVCKWLQEMDRRQALDRYFHLPLTPVEQETVRLEGWILGIA